MNLLGISEVDYGAAVIAEIDELTAWEAAVTDEIQAMPETLGDVADPYMVGWLDGEVGRPCDALTQYVRLGDIESYIIGHKDATEAIAEALDLQDAREDDQWHSRGAW